MLTKTGLSGFIFIMSKKCFLLNKLDVGNFSTSVADPGCLSRIQIFPSRIKVQNVSGSASKNISIFNPKNVSKVSEIWSRCSSRIPDPGFGSWFFYPSRTPDPEVKKAPDPGSGSATLFPTIVGYFVQGKDIVWRGYRLNDSHPF